MKKILSVVAAVALVLALSVTAFAATPSVSYDNKNDIKSEDTVTVNGEEATVAVETTELTTEEKAVLEEAIANIKGATAAEVVDVELKDANGNSVSENYFNENETLTVVFVRDDTTSEVVGVLYWNAETEAWDEAEFETGDGTVKVTFKHLCSVAFVTKAVESSGTTTTTTTTNGGKKSPQTGNDTTVWTAAATVMVLAAVCCFVSARKKVTA